jgi:methylmalonyl-CoA/ethylmalonyl-CoA epimerase
MSRELCGECLEEKKSGGINHICYTNSAIDDAVATLRYSGYLTLHPPEPAVAFDGRRIAWLMNRDHLLVELVEQGPANGL